MNTHMELELATVRLEEARAWASRQAVIKSLRSPRQPMRVVVGLGLVRVGRWLARPAVKRSAEPGRAIA